MEFDAFQGGVKIGGLFNINLVRVLLCYLLARFGKPLNKEILFHAIQSEELANYFEIVDAYSELVKNKHIIEDNSLCTVSESGKMIADQLDTELPLTVREKSLSAILKLLLKEKNETENKVEIKSIENGKIVSCKIMGGEDICLCDLNLYVPDDIQAEVVKRNFYNIPDILYRTIISMLTEDSEMLNTALDDFYRNKPFSEK